MSGTDHLGASLSDKTPGGATERLIADLRARFGGRLVTGLAVREQHSRGEGVPLTGLPDAVVFPESNEEVAAIVGLCQAVPTPIVPFGTGTSLEGHVAALRGGVSLDLSHMKAVLAVSPEAMDCRVQAGITRNELNRELRDTGLFFPVDPGADASIGGMAATRASGTSAVRYGTMRDNVLGLTVVTPVGGVIHTGGRARKSSAGLDLTALFVGSEGTLGVITEIQLRLQPLPETIIAAVCQFPTVGEAVGAVVAGRQMGITFARVELLNEVQMQACIAYSDLAEFAPLPTLFLEFSGTPLAATEQMEMTQAICAEYGGSAFAFASQLEDRNRLWKARHQAYYAVLALAPGRKSMVTDACVPISALAECIRETEADIEESGLVAPIVGHVGDGNFHLCILYDADDSGETRRAEALAWRVGERAIRLGGTCTGEHGVGVHKAALLDQEHGEAVDLMRAVKRALDPRSVMNPGKMFSGQN